MASSYHDILKTFARLLDVSVGDFEIGLWTIVVGMIANTVCAILGCYLVLRRMSLLGDAISHAILPGLAIAFLLGGTTSPIPMFIGAMTSGLVCAFLAQSLQSSGRIAEDSSLGVVFTSLFALGVILISRVDRVHLDADCVLYGLIEFVAIDTVPYFGIEVPHALNSLVPVLVLTLVFVTVMWKELKIVSFDSTLATAMGINAVLVHYLLMGMVAAATVASFEAVGSILVVAMLIVPGATAHLLTDRLGWMIVWAVVVGMVSAIVGYLLAVEFKTSVAGMMAVVAGLQFTLAVFLAPKQGLVGKALGNLALRLRIVAEDIIGGLYRDEEHFGKRPYVAARNQCLGYAGEGLLAALAVRWLQYRGRLETSESGGLSLTRKGRRLGESLVRSHRLWETYLDEHFALPADHLHEPAARLEHYIGPELQDRLERELRLPDVDPHGKSIPRPGRDPQPPDE